MKRRRINYHQSIAVFLTAAAALHSAAALSESRYLPESRYSSALPSPTLLYPENAQPLFPHYSEQQSLAPPATAPLPDPVEIRPQAGFEQAAPPPLPMAAPAVPATPLPAQPITPSQLKLLPPPPAPRQEAPLFQPLNTLETLGAATNIHPQALARQPVRLPPEPAARPVVQPAPAALDTSIALKPPASALNIKRRPEPPTIDAETQSILSRIPGGIDSNRQSTGSTDLKRFDPAVKGVLDAPEVTDESIARHETVGVKIAIRQPSLEVNTELQNAYDALMGGQPQIALQIYKDILQQIPNHEDALFGIATTYHRTGELERARPYYIKLLKLNPKHRDGLINFLSLVAQEAPEEATAKLEYLARQNPDFSAIPALLGVLYDKMGKTDKAIDSMIRAVRMEPENLAYKYNLAVMYDQKGLSQDAIVLYNQLLAAGRSGLPLPAPMRDLQERIIFINGEMRQG